MHLPYTKIRNLNDLTISWDKVFQSSSHASYKLQVCDDFKQWKTIYLGPKTEFKAERLAPCTCYEFRIKLGETDNDWVYFKAATEDLGPYTGAIHITRAVKLGKTSVIRKIAQLKPSLLNSENKENKTPIIQAIETKDFQVLQLLLTLGANVNKPLLHTKKTALMFAIYKGELQAASFLIEKGADIWARDINGLSILHYAVDSDDVINVEFAVATGIDINLSDNGGWTPLIRAGCKSKIHELLISKGANILVQDKNGFDYHKHKQLNALINVT